MKTTDRTKTDSDNDQESAAAETDADPNEHSKESWELRVEWRPVHRKLTIIVIYADAEKIIKDTVYDKSPVIIPGLPAPKNGKYSIKWAMDPEQPIHKLEIQVRNCTTGKSTSVVKKDDLEALWQSTKEGVTIDAP
jgi:hypothetical protein